MGTITVTKTTPRYERAKIEFLAAFIAVQPPFEEPASIYITDGRRYDKLIIKTAKTTRVVYFIERATGAIFGPANDLMPSPRHYFGTVYKAVQWDWARYPAEPIDMNDVDAQLVEGKGYRYFIPKGKKAPGPKGRRPLSGAKAKKPKTLPRKDFWDA